MQWTEKIGKVFEPAAKFLQNGSHAQQAIPSQHRLLAAGGMFVGWWALDKIRDIAFGMNQVSEGEYEEIKREDVPLPLRFLHKTIDWNPHSDAPEEQWKKLAHQLLPAIGAGVGTVAGSTFAFQLNEREQKFAALKNKKGLWWVMDAEDAAQHAQSKPLRILTAFTGGFSAASMLPLVYGAFLNMAFASANGARIFTHTLAAGNAGPAKALDTQLGSLPAYVKSALNKDGKINEAWAKGFVDKVLTPLFGKKLDTPEAQAEVRGKIQKILEDTFKNYEKKLASGAIEKDDFVKEVAKEVEDKFGKGENGLKTTLKELNLDMKDVTLGNANPAIRAFNELLVKIGVVSKENSAASFAAKIQEQNFAKAAGQGMGGAPA